ncbi:hypothetical protein [uncultured Brachybacterium sp.]|uniref:hypothetical protein n=1 Tax=uncultured Brachybacterium sp. TaxID=189680 RepID=UPI00260DED21|nr:hypothetical protein [uncultured Brachybacterium sp.]
MSAAQIPHRCGAECITDTMDGSAIHSDLVGTVEGVEVRAAHAGAEPRVLIDAGGLVDIDRCDAVRLAVKILTAAARFESPGAR